VIVSQADVEALRARHLMFPCPASTAQAARQLRGPARARSRIHAALDMRGGARTPVLAVEGGTIARLHNFGRAAAA
jgi:murein DD-endopeptidase MepM/ murein hydrolase activator NlpD